MENLHKYSSNVALLGCNLLHAWHMQGHKFCTFQTNKLSLYLIIIINYYIMTQVAHAVYSVHIITKSYDYISLTFRLIFHTKGQLITSVFQNLDKHKLVGLWSTILYVKCIIKCFLKKFRNIIRAKLVLHPNDAAEALSLAEEIESPVNVFEFHLMSYEAV